MKKKSPSGLKKPLPNFSFVAIPKKYKSFSGLFSSFNACFRGKRTSENKTNTFERNNVLMVSSDLNSASNLQYFELFQVLKKMIVVRLRAFTWFPEFCAHVK
jgi:hypothetical protein